MNRTLKMLAIPALAAVAFCLLMGSAVAFADQTALPQAAVTPASDSADATALVNDDKSDDPKKEDPPPMAEVPTGEKTESGLRWTISFERGDGYASFSRQNDMLRVDVDVRLPYSAGDGQANRGSCLDLVLSVNGLHGRHLFFYPNPVWMPDGNGRFTAYRVEYSFDKDRAEPSALQDEPSFAGTGDVKYWDRWKATLWVDLRYVLVPGNTPTSRADTWLAGLVMGNEAATMVFPTGMDVQNPGKTPDRLLTFKYSELPELDDKEENPRDELIEAEEKVHEAQRNVEARFSMQGAVDAFKALQTHLKTCPDQLWGHYLVYILSYTAEVRGIQGIDTDYLKFLRAYVEACPGQSSVHLDLLRNLLPVGKHDEALAHASRIFESDLCTGRAATDGYMRLKWAEICIPWGLSKQALQQLEYIKGKPELLKDDSFRVDFNFQRAEYAMRTGDSKTAVAIYEAMLRDERKFLNTNQFNVIQQNLQFQRQAVEQWEDELKFQAEDAKKTNPRWLIETSRGKIVIELFEDDSPNTVKSLVKLARDKFYDDQTFHRVEPNFVAQGGDPNGDGSGGPGYRIKFEENRRAHFRGTVAMARAQAKDSAGSQFYICTANSPNVLSLTGSYVVVGRVIEGMEVADMLRVGDKIISIRAENLRDHEYKPEVMPE